MTPSDPGASWEQMVVRMPHPMIRQEAPVVPDRIPHPRSHPPTRWEHVLAHPGTAEWQVREVLGLVA